jgi:hypothetical protein
VRYQAAPHPELTGNLIILRSRSFIEVVGCSLVHVEPHEKSIEIRRRPVLELSAAVPEYPGLSTQDRRRASAGFRGCPCALFDEVLRLAIARQPANEARRRLASWPHEGRRVLRRVCAGSQFAVRLRMRKPVSASTASSTNHAGNACRAAWTAASMSPALAMATRPVSAPVAGLKTGPLLPDDPGTFPPPTWRGRLRPSRARPSSYRPRSIRTRSRRRPRTPSRNPGTPRR